MSETAKWKLMAALTVGMGLGGFIQVLPSWDVLWQPNTIGGLLMIICGSLLGLVTKRPGDVSIDELANSVVKKPVNQPRLEE